MEEDYTTISAESVDGYLGLMIGSQLWHPLWNSELLHSTVDAVTEEMSKHRNSERHHSVEDIHATVRRNSTSRASKNTSSAELEGKLEDITARYIFLADLFTWVTHLNRLAQLESVLGRKLL